jgi:hypothetical protein
MPMVEILPGSLYRGQWKESLAGSGNDKESYESSLPGLSRQPVCLKVFEIGPKLANFTRWRFNTYELRTKS